MINVPVVMFQQWLDGFPSCLSKGTLKRYFIDIYLTTFLEVRNFEVTSGMTVIFLLNMLKI